MTPGETYLTTEELIERWGHRIGEPTLRMWRTRKRRRGPPFIKHGQRVLYPLSALELWEKSMTANIPGLKLA